MRNFTELKKYLYGHIPQGSKQTFPGQLGLARAKYLLKLLGNPQEKIKVIHIAGTSGKGSTAYLISILLKAHGFKVGLHLSPHLLDLRERFQINNQLINENKTVSYFEKLLPAIDILKKSRFGSPTYFEILVAFAYYIFYEEKIDYAVMETGMGGWYDATNVVRSKNKLCVITRLGLDHTRILGKTIKEIALQKAKIIQTSNSVVTIRQKPAAQAVFDRVINEEGAKLYLLDKTKNYQNIRILPELTVFDYHFDKYRLNNLSISLLGGHQAENATLAQTTVIILSQRDSFRLNENIIREVFTKAVFPGRLHWVRYQGRSILLDGAHNPQKMAALIKSLKKIYPNKMWDFVVAFKKGKDIQRMLQMIIPIANQIIISTFNIEATDMIHLAEDPMKIAAILDNLGYNNYLVIPQVKDVLNQLANRKSELKIITGSLYLLAEVYSQSVISPLHQVF